MRRPLLVLLTLSPLAASVEASPPQQIERTRPHVRLDLPTIGMQKKRPEAPTAAEPVLEPPADDAFGYYDGDPAKTSEIAENKPMFGAEETVTLEREVPARIPV